jgi:hypothetical protein
VRSQSLHFVRIPAAERRLLATASALLVGLTITLAGAQDDVIGFELVSSRLPIASTPFSATRGTTHGEAIVGRARLAYWDRPISLVAASASSNGSRSDLVAGALSFEVAFQRTWQNGWDVGLNAGLHLYQFGEGTTLTVGKDQPLPHFGVMDPMLELGRTWQLSKFSLRPFGALYFPMGHADAFAGERRLRAEAGLALLHRIRFFEWGIEASALYRPPIELSTTRWGSQAKLAVAARALIGSQFSAGPEFVVRPILIPQNRGEPAYLIPAQASINLGYQNRWLGIVFNYGLGLPISRISSEIDREGRQRSPTTPIQSLMLTGELTLK